MKKAEIKVGGLYTARVSGNFVTVRVDKIRVGTSFDRDCTYYDVTNLKTGRKTTFRSAAKFRSEVNSKATKVEPIQGTTVSAEIYEDIEEGEQRSDPTTPMVAALSAMNPSTVIASAVSDVLSATTHAQAAPISKFASRLAAVATPREVPAVVAGYTPTDEQRTILETVLEVLYGDGPKVLVIEAGAGAGKTSTLKMLEEVLPGAGQYTAFNKSLVDDSRPKFRKARCQPDGTMIRVSVPGLDQGHTCLWRDVPIESLKDGDKVVSWQGFAGCQKIRKRGKSVKVFKRHYEGPLITASANNFTSSYTPEHPCVVVLDEVFDGKHVVYMMRRGGNYKIGLCSGRGSIRVRPHCRKGGNGLMSRIRSEMADAAWVLGVFDDRDEAALTEAMLQYQFNVPGWTFQACKRPPSRGGNRVRRSEVGLHRLWERIPSNRHQATACLKSFNLDIDAPLWSVDAKINFDRSPVIVNACNLLNGMKMLVFDECRKGGNNLWTPKKVWKRIEVSVHNYCGNVTSLEVADDHTYFADGLLTHNCNTTHSLAFQPCGRDYSHRLNCGRVKSSDVAKLLGIQDYTVDLGPIPQGGAEWDKAIAKAGYDDKNPPPATFAPRAYKVLNAGMLAGQVTKALRKFSQSSEREIKPENFEYIGGIDHKRPDGKRGWENNRKVREYLMPFAEKAWADVVKKDGDFPFTHDYYVKIWQLGTPVIGADYILLDEDQDTAAVFADIIRRQRQAMVVLVGDENQSIYGWRGAINATRLFPEAKVCYLTQSFRFGQTVADVANSILKGLAEPTKLRMRGLPNQPTRVVMGAGREADEDRSADHVGRVCYLYRTNAGAVGRILREHEQGRNGCLIGNIDDILSFVEGALDLQRGRRTTNAELAAFETWAEVCKYVEEDPDGEDLKLNVDLVEDFGAQAIISALKNMPKEEYADFVCSTAHKSKGREWPTVVLGQDFPPAVNMGDEDRRLLYVAATRAKLVLDLSVCTPFYPYTDREGITTPGIEVEYTVPMPTREDLQAWITAKAAPQSPTKPVPNVGINDSGVMAVAAPAANPAPANGSSGGDYTWGKVGEDWCVRGPVDQKIGSRVEVRKRDGRTSTETLRSVVKKMTDVWFYGVR